MRAFLEKINKEWLDEFVYMSKQPFIDLGIEVIPFETVLIGGMADLLRHNPTNKDVIFASVECCEAFFAACGVETPKYIGYPEVLRPFCHRLIQTMTMDELEISVATWDDRYPFFVKPKEKVKLFTGCVIENESLWNTFKKMYPIPGNTELYTSSTVNIISEYRCFVHKSNLKGIKHYAGDFTVFPSEENIQELDRMILAYSQEAPASYTLDIGILLDGSCVLIEVNDVWALGTYGFDPKIYVRMVIDRFQEILKA